jgi:hypothetical protein
MIGEKTCLSVMEDRIEKKSIAHWEKIYLLILGLIYYFPLKLLGRILWGRFK